MARTAGWMMLAGTLMLVGGCNDTREPATVESNVTMPLDAGDNDADAAAENTVAANDSAPEPDFAGRWIGPEGMFLDIAADSEVGPGHYTIRNRWGLDADAEGSFKGSVTGGVLRFTRPDGDQTLTPGNGEATGMKYLLDKSDCLIVRTGEGYCRA